MNVELMSHSMLEVIAEQAEDYLCENEIPLVSHSYKNIILQAQSCGFSWTNLQKTD